MAKGSTARDERYQRSREAGLPAAHGQPREPVPADLDRLIHERVRLGIVSALAVNRSLTFNELKAMLKTTDGNLSVHAENWKKPITSCARNPLTVGCPRRSTGWQRRGAKRWSAI